MTEIHKEMKQLDSEYKNRVLTDDDITNLFKKRKRGRPKAILNIFENMEYDVE